MLAAALVGKEGEVFTFEPNSENARLLLLNAEINTFPWIKLYPLALSDKAGHAYFSSFIGSNGGFLTGASSELADGRGVVVPTATLDCLVKTPVDFIKLDVEGAEYRVLRGGSALLSCSRPIVSIEFSCEMIKRVSRVDPREILSMFTGYGYAIYVVDKTSGRLDAIRDVDAFLATWGPWDRIEDLLMLPAGRTVLQPEQ